MIVNTRLFLLVLTGALGLPTALSVAQSRPAELPGRNDLEALRAEETQRLAGAWLIQVTPTSISSGPLQPPFKAVFSLTRDGQVVGADTGILPPGIRASIALGEWTRVGNREFSVTFSILLSLSQNGGYAGLSKTRSTIRLNEVGDALTGDWRADVEGPVGNPTFTLRGLFEGERIGVQPFE